MSTSSDARDLYRAGGKRTLDLVGAGLALPVLGVASLVVAPLIKLEDRGPVLYASRRRGRGGREFTMYKFRTMHVAAPDLRNPDRSTFNATDDLRVTRVGRFLREASVDELPQLLNVLRGDMSLVGPRPNLATSPLESLTPLERKRITVAPGITGYSQAYYRNSIPTVEKYAHDAHYVGRLSLRLDVQIMLRTITSVLRRRGVYGTEDRDVGPV